jgi:hypothetical protein
MAMQKTSRTTRTSKKSLPPLFQSDTTMANTTLPLRSTTGSTIPEVLRRHPSSLLPTPVPSSRRESLPNRTMTRLRLLLLPSRSLSSRSRRTRRLSMKPLLIRHGRRRTRAAGRSRGGTLTHLRQAIPLLPSRKHLLRSPRLLLLRRLPSRKPRPTMTRRSLSKTQPSAAQPLPKSKLLSNRSLSRGLPSPSWTRPALVTILLEMRKA